MTVSAQFAEENLSQLMTAAEQGEVVRIERGAKPAVRLTLDQADLELPDDDLGETEHPVQVRPRSEFFGCMKGRIVLHDDWDSAETNAEIERLFEESVLFPEPPQSAQDQAKSA